MSKKHLAVACLVVGAALGLVGYGLQADEFSDQDVERWQGEFMSVVQEGRALWVSADLGSNGVACAQCHPNAANTHPETYPKFQQQLGGVVAFRDMINWCLMNPLEGDELDLDDDRMIALEAYATWERRGVELEPGKH
ncbi:MAG TPA: cytochrome C [Methylomirabilota bacterium]|nr:cytochrome C [Methylomirabilota bacterium]